MSSGAQVTALRARLSPSFALLIFLVLPATLLIRPDSMLTDPGVGWHLKTGEYILDTGRIPAADLFSFTRSDAPWVPHEWLFEVLAALLTRLGGLPLLSAAAALAWGALPVLLYRRMVRDGAVVALAAPVSVASCILFAAHAHARPHVVTYIGFLLLTDRLARFDRGVGSARSLVWFVPAMLFWANVHGGFVVAPAVAGIFLLGSLIRYAASGAAVHLRRARVYGILGTGMIAVSLINPAGWNLHLAIFRYLSSESLAVMAEYQSPDFRNPSLAVLLFGALIVGLLLVGRHASRSPDLTESLLLVFFLYQALTAVRHMFLFAILAVPVLVGGLSPWVEAGRSRLSAALREIGSRQASLTSDRIWFPVASAACVCLALGAPGLFRTDLDGIHLSRGARLFIEQHDEELGPMFNTSSLGGALVYGFWPERRVFGDDRNDFYGDSFVLGEYLPVLSAGHGWQAILNRYGVTSAIVLRDEIPGELFRASPDWRLAYRDDVNEIFFSKP